MAIINFDRFEDRDPAKQVELRSWKDTLIDPLVDYPPPEYLIRIGGIGAFPRGDIQAIKGKAKAGKTTAMSLITAGMLGDDFTEALTMFSRPKGRSKILHIDTEQHPRSVAWKQKTVYKLIGAETDHPLQEYAVLSLREFSFSDRWDIAKEAIHDFKPDFVLIDGIVDMIADFNDSAESKAFISELMALASRENCAICCVLHENKSKGDNTMRGHLGTELLNKCSETYQVSQLNGIFTVTQTESRNAPAPDFAFTIDPEGLPVMADENPKIDQKEKLLVEAMAIFNMVLKDGERMMHSDLQTEFAERYGCTERTARSRIAKLYNRGFLAKTKEGLYKINDHEDSIFYGEKDEETR